ncbi:MAG: carbohydrate kinase [Bauldia sp.]
MIISCGEALIDFLPRRGPDGATAFRPYAGGSPFNVAVALARLGAEAGFFGGLSTDFFGAMLGRALADSGVNTEFADVSDRPSTLAFVSLEDGDARYAFFDHGSAGRMLTETDLPALPRTVAALHFGSFSLAEEPCGSALEALMRREQRDRVISLDPNVRPTLIKNRDGYLARLDRLAAMSDIVRLSQDDLAWLAPGSTFATIARRWLASGCKVVVLTKGAAGAEALSTAGPVSVPGLAIAVVDTIGAGDSFTAGVLARLDQLGLVAKRAVGRLSADQLADVLAFATRAAAITVARAGADPPWLSEMTASA